MVAPADLLAPHLWQHRVSSAWYWWISELAQLLPSGVRTRLAASRAPVIVDLGPDEIVVTHGAAAVRLPLADPHAADVSPPEDLSSIQSVPRDRPVLLRLPVDQVLRRTLVLPRNAMRNLPRILRFEVERLSPLDLADISWDWVLADRQASPDTLEVTVWLIRSDVFEEAVAACRNLGISPTALGLIGESTQPRFHRLFASRNPSLIERVGRIATPTLAVLAATLGLLVIYAQLADRQASIEQLQARVERAKTAAQGVDRLRASIKQSTDRTGFMAQRKQEPWTLAVIAEVTRLLPDNAWLTQLQINGREVRIQGQTPRASILIELFGQSRFFANAQFRAPVTREVKGDLERFDLSFELRGGK